MNEMPPPRTSSIEQTLQRIATQFTVRDIMVPVEKLVKAKTPVEARRLLEEYNDFNVVPVGASGKITGYIERNSPDLKSIDFDMTVGSGCSILDIVDVFAERQFCFVLGKWGIEGYVHFSDLNHHLVNLPFYILLQAVESHIISLIQDRLDEEVLHEVFDTSDANKIIKSFNKKKLNDVNRSLLNEISLKMMLQVAVYFGLLELSDEEITELYKVRNSLSHAPERLIQRHDDAKRLMWTIRQCHKILGSYSTTN